MKRLFLLLLILLTNFAFTYTNQPVSRNLDPENHPIENYDVYKDSHVLKTGKFVVEYESKASRNEKLLVIVEDSIYPEIRDNLLIYTRDNENEGINVDVVTYDGTLISELKSFIVDEYYENSISGLFFIGDLPSAWYEMTEDFDPEDDNESFVQFPIDLFFTDIDGIWIDANGNDVFDEHSGEVHPELYLGVNTSKQNI